MLIFGCIINEFDDFVSANALYLFNLSINKWIEESEAANYWFAGKLRMVVVFLMKEIECQRAMYSARYTRIVSIFENIWIFKSFAVRLRVVSLISSQLHNFLHLTFLFRLTCQLAITEVDVTSFNSVNSVDDDFLLNIKPSAEAEKELALLRERDSQVFKKVGI